MPSLPRIALAGAAALLLFTHSHAQTPVWSSLPAPAGTTLGLEQGYGYAVAGNTVHACSTLNGAWTSITTLFGPPAVTRSNDHFIVQDGPYTFHAWSPRTGACSTQYAFSGSATLVAQSSPQTWHSVLLDGNAVHIYFAYTGSWHTWSFTAPPAIRNGRFCVLIDDGTSVIGVSSIHGSAVPLGVSGATAVAAEGCLGLATSAGSIHGFSAFRNQWTTTTLAGTPVISWGNAQPGFAAIRDGSNYIFYSGHTGTFQPVPASASATLTNNRQVAVVIDGTQVTCYSGLLGTAAAMTFGTTPNPVTNQYLALLDEGFQVTPYSPLTGAFGPSMPGSYTITAGAQIAHLTPSPGGTQPVVAYSTNNNTWVSVPAVPGAVALLTGCSMMLVDPAGGLYGLSARGSAFVYEPTGPIDAQFQGSGALSGTLVARSGTMLYAFNPKTDRFRSTTTTGLADNFQGHTGALVLRDAVNAYGFSNFRDGWSSVPLAGPVTIAQIQTHNAILFDGSYARFFAGTGQIVTTGEFPDFWRAMTRGGRFQLNVAGEGNAPLVLAVSLDAAEIPLGPPGTLLLDPTSLLILLQGQLPSSGSLGLALLIPDDPSFHGAEFHFQAFIAGPMGGYLTSSAIATIF